MFEKYAQTLIPLAGRMLLGLIFAISGFKKILGFAGTAGYMASKGLPMTDVLLVLTILVELGGGLMLIAGWKTCWVAMALFLFMIPTSIIFHPFWNGDAQAAMNQIQFLKNLAIMGGMLMLVANGPGQWTADGSRKAGT
jgi:putative oxidoreductase